MPLFAASSPLPVSDQALHSGEVGSGTQLSVNTEGSKATYSSSIFGHAPAATPTDFFTILGSASKTVRVLRLWIAGRATAAAWYRVRCLKYSTAYSGGTAAAVTRVPHDSTNLAPSHVVNTWAGGLPTVGSLLGAIHDDDLALNAAALTATQPFVDPPGLLWDFTLRNGQGIVLRGAGEYLALNGVGVALPTGTVFDVKVEVSEE